MKIDFTKADGIIEVTETCLECGGHGKFLSVTRNQWRLCPHCDGKGKLTELYTPEGLRQKLEHDFTGDKYD